MLMIFFCDFFFFWGGGGAIENLYDKLSVLVIALMIEVSHSELTESFSSRTCTYTSACISMFSE